MSTPTAAKKTAAAPRTSTAKTAPAAGSTSAERAPVKTLADHLAVLSEGEVMSPSGLHGFLESMRAVTTGLAFFTQAAATQLEAAMRQAARDSKDGRLTLAEKTKLKMVLRKASRNMDALIKEALLDAARGSVKSYEGMKEFLDELESTQVSRPHRSNRGGFDLFNR